MIKVPGFINAGFYSAARVAHLVFLTLVPYSLHCRANLNLVNNYGTWNLTINVRNLSNKIEKKMIAKCFYVYRGSFTNL